MSEDYLVNPKYIPPISPEIVDAIEHDELVVFIGTGASYLVDCMLWRELADKLVQYIKGYTSRKLLMDYKELNKQFWGQHLWARGGDFVANSGNVTDEVIIEYIKNQDIAENQRSDNFNVDREFKAASAAHQPTGFSR